MLASAAPAAAQEGTVVLHMGDGTSFPLRAWSLSYEYLAWKQGTPQCRVSPTRKETSALWVGKKAYPVKDATLELRFTPAQRQREKDGEMQLVTIQVATGLVLVGHDGKREEFKLEPPHRDLLIPEADKNTLLAVRSLELSGETLTGTRREFCLVSFTSLVECPSDAPMQVVKAEFQ